MPNNKLSDLEDHLFAQIERLDDDKITGEDLAKEVDRAKAISGLAAQIINSRKLTLEAVKLVASGNARANELPEGFGIKPQNQLPA
jgi:hypothetical protein